MAWMGGRVVRFEGELDGGVRVYVRVGGVSGCGWAMVGRRIW